MNPIVSFYRQSNPNDPRPDDDILLDYGTTYGADALERDYPGFAQDWWEALERKHPSTLKEKAGQVFGSAVRGLTGTVAAIPESVASLAALAGQASVPGGLDQPAAPLVPGWSDLGIRALGEKVSPEPIRGLERNFWLTQAPQGIASTAGFMAGGLAGKALKVPATVATALLGAAAGGQQGYQDVVAQGGTGAQAAASMGLNAAVGTSEALPLAGMLERINQGTGGQLGQIIRSAIAEAGEETVQEALQQTLGNLIASDIVRYDPDRGWSEGVGSNAAVGGVSGAFVSVLSSLIGKARGRVAQPAPAPGAPPMVVPPSGPPPAPAALTPTTPAVAPPAAPPAPPAPPAAPVTPGQAFVAQTHPEDSAWIAQATELAKHELAGTLTPAETQQLEALKLTDPSGSYTRYKVLRADLAKNFAPPPAQPVPPQPPPVAPAPPPPVTGEAEQTGASPVPPPPPVAQTPAPPSPPSVASVPAMITKKMEGDLLARGFTQEAVNKLTPQQAWAILKTPDSARPPVPQAPPAQIIQAARPAPAPLVSPAAVSPTLDQRVRAELGLAAPVNPTDQTDQTDQTVTPTPPAPVAPAPAKPARKPSGRQVNKIVLAAPTVAPEQLASMVDFSGAALVEGKAGRGKRVAPAYSDLQGKTAAAAKVETYKDQRAASGRAGKTEEKKKTGIEAIHLTRKLAVLLAPDKATVLVGRASEQKTTKDPGGKSNGKNIRKGFVQVGTEDLFWDDLIAQKYQPLAALKVTEAQHDFSSTYTLEQWRELEAQFNAARQKAQSYPEASEAVMQTSWGKRGAVNSDEVAASTMSNDHDEQQEAAQAEADREEASAAERKEGKVGARPAPIDKAADRAAKKEVPSGLNPTAAGQEATTDAEPEATWIDLTPVEVLWIVNTVGELSADDLDEGNESESQHIIMGVLASEAAKTKAIVGEGKRGASFALVLTKQIYDSYRKAYEENPEEDPAQIQTIAGGILSEVRGLPGQPRGPINNTPNSGANLSQTGRHTRSEGAGVYSNAQVADAEVRRRFNDLLDVAHYQGLLVQVRDGVAQEEGVYDPSKRKTTLSLIDAANPTIESLRVALHEVAHDLFAQESPEMQAAILAAIDTFSQEQLGIANSIDPTIRNQDVLSIERELRAAGTTDAATTARARLAEERLAEHLALQGLNREPARGIAANLIRAIKDLLYRIGMAIQRAWGRVPSANLAMAYAENRFAAFVAGQRAMSVFEFMVPPMAPGKLVTTFIPSQATGWIAERPGPDGQAQFGAVADADIRWQLRHTRSQPARPGAPSARNESVVVNSAVALANAELDVQAKVTNAVGPLSLVQEYLKESGAQLHTWLRNALGLKNATGQKAAALAELDPITKEPIPGNPDQAIADFQDANNRIRLGIDRLALVQDTQSKMGNRVKVATEWIKGNEARIQQQSQEFEDSTRNYTDVDRLAAEVANGVRSLLRRPGLILRSLRALGVEGNPAEAIDEAMKGEFFKSSFDWLDRMTAQGVDLGRPIIQIRDELAAHGSAFEPLVNSPVKLAVLITYAKRNAWALARMDLRKGTDLTERQKIIADIQAALAGLQVGQDIGAQIPAVGRAARLSERVMAAFRAERSRVTKDVNQLRKKKSMVAAGEMALKFYAQEAEALMGAIGAHSQAIWGHGMKYSVPVKQPDGTWKIVTKTIALNAGGKITDRAALERDLTDQLEYLNEREAANQLTAEYYQVRADHDEIVGKGMFSPDVVETIHRCLGKWIGSLAERMISLGSPSSRGIAAMIANYTARKQFWRAESERLGMAVERARLTAMRVLDSSGQNWESYRANFFEPAVRYLESRRDLMESGLSVKAQWDQAFTDFRRWLLSLPASDPRKTTMAGKDAELLRALRAHIEAENDFDQWLVDHNIDQVFDPRIKIEGKDTVRKRYRLGLVTMPRRLSKEFNAMYAAMHPDQDGTARGEANWAELAGAPGQPGAWVNLGQVYDGKLKIKDARGQEVTGPEAVRAMLAPYFKSERVQRWFLAELATREPESALPGKLLDEETRLELSPYVAQEAYDQCGGDVVKLAELIYDREGGVETKGEYLQQVLDRLRGFYLNIANTYANHAPEAAGRTPTLKNLIPGFMIYARTVEGWPAAWTEHLSLDRHAGLRAVDMIAAQTAFGAKHASLIKLFETVDAEVTADTQKLANAERFVTDQTGGVSIRGKAFEKALAAQVGGEAEMRRLYRVRQRANLVIDFANELPAAFHQQHLTPDEFRLGRQSISFLANRLLQQFSSALTLPADAFSFFRTYGLGGAVFKAAASVPWRALKSTVGSLTQAFLGRALPVGSGFRKEMFRLGLRDPLIFQDLKTQLAEAGQAGEAWTRTGARWLRKAEAVLSAGINRAGANARDVVFRPMAPFTQLATTINLAVVESSGDMVEDYLRRGVDFLKNNAAAAQDVTFGLEPGAWADAMGLKGSGRASFEKVRRIMLDKYGLDFGRMAREAIAREAGGQYLMSDESIIRLSGMALNEVCLENNLATMTPAAFNNDFFRAAIPLLGWSIRQSKAIAQMGMNSQGTGTRWFQVPRNRQDVATVTRALMTLAAMVAGGLAVGMLVDWYNEELLGKRRNLRQVSLRNGPAQNFFAMIEQTARIGTFGLVGDVANAALSVGTGEGDNRGISLDQRIVVASSVLNLQKAISNFVNQDWKADYVGVIRPVLMTAGGNGALQYLQLFSNLTGFDNPEARAVERTNVSNWLRAAGRTAGLEIRPSRGGFGTPTPVTPYITQMQLAALSNAGADFRTAWHQAVDVARKEGKDDPETYIRQAFENRNPMISIFRNRPDEQDYRKLMAAMPERGRQDVSEAIRLFNAYAESIGGKAFTFSKSKTVKPLDLNAIRRKIFSGLGQPRMSWTLN